MKTGEQLLTPPERRKYLDLCREHGEVIQGFFMRLESERIDADPVVRKIRRELDWYIDLQTRRWKAQQRQTP